MSLSLPKVNVVVRDAYSTGRRLGVAECFRAMQALGDLAIETTGGVSFHGTIDDDSISADLTAADLQQFMYEIRDKYRPSRRASRANS